MDINDDPVNELISRLVQTGICNSIGDSISISDTDFRILYQNTAHMNLFGNHPGEFCFNAYAALDKPCDDCPLVHVFSDSGVYQTEWHIPSKTESRCYEITASPLKNEAGRTVAGVEVIRDITRRKEIEKKVKENEKRYRLLLEIAFDGIAVTERGRFLEVSEKFARIFGYDHDEIIGETLSLLSAPECLDDAMQKIMSGYDEPYETVGIKKNGTRFQMEVCGKSFHYKNLKCRITAIRDISNRKRAERELRKSESKLVESQKIAHVGSWEYNVSDDKLWWSDEVYTIFGLDLHVNNITFDTFTSLIHEDDRRILRDQVRSGLPYRLDYRIIRPDGEIRHVHEEMRMRKNRDSLPELMWGTIQDITDRKKLEEQLQAAAITDDLTGLFNRRGFFALAEQQCKVADRSGKGATLLYIDVDGLKTINDKLGHKEGDSALIDSANLLRHAFRDSDIIGRLGGDEFAVLLSEPANRDDEDVILENIHNTLAEFNDRAARNYELKFSVGIAHSHPGHSLSIDELVARADHRMYENKRKRQFQKNTRSHTQERRAFQRNAIHECRAEMSGSEPFMVKNISRGGLCLQMSRKLIPGTFHNQITIFCEQTRISAKCVLIWSAQTSELPEGTETSYEFETGLKFIGLSDGQKRSIDSVFSNLSIQ